MNYEGRSESKARCRQRWLSSVSLDVSTLIEFITAHWFVCAVIAGVLFLVFPSFVLMDSLIEYEFDWHRAAWEADGSPRGFNWRPPDGISSSDFARHRLCLVWLFTTPEWIRSA